MDQEAAKFKKPPSAVAAAAAVGPQNAPQPQPGGKKNEYWVAARSLNWDIVPTGKDEWMAQKIKGKKTFRAFVYQQFSDGFASPIGPATMPGPRFTGEVGDTIVVHFRNADERLNQAVTLHPHGVKYTPNYDGSYLGDFTLAGGFIAPGEEFTYTWECTPDSVGVWPYHDHGPNHTINTMRGLFGALIVYEKGAKRPDVEETILLHSFPPNVTGLDKLFHCINGHAYAGNTTTYRAKVGPGRRLAHHRRERGLPHLPRPRPPLEERGRHLRGHAFARAQRDEIRSLGRRQPRPLALPLSRLFASGHGHGRLVHRRVVMGTPHERGDGMRIARPLTSAVAVAVALAVPTAAMATDYPEPTNPGGVKNPPKGGTLRVCKPKTKKPKGCFKTIQKAIDSAGKGTKILVPNGTYKEGLKIVSPVKAGIKLIGNAKDPSKVTLEGKSLKGGASQNGVQINNADGVTIQGIHAQNYKANGFFAVNVDGYTMKNLVANNVGAYGLYAFNSTGGSMTDSEAFYNNDSGMYVGQTPVQTKPKRTILKNLVSWGNVLGYSGTNSKYVTITKSKFFNNGLGVVPNVLTSEKFAPASDNVIADNDIFWNNFNYRHTPAPFPSTSASTDGTPYPIGGGLLLFGGQNTTVESNRFWGNYLFGAGEISQILDADKLGDAANCSRTTSSRTTCSARTRSPRTAGT